MTNFEVLLPKFNDRTFNILDFGATEGGKDSNTKAINACIEKANKEGGGKVIIPNGIWLTGPITLLSNVNLNLEDSAYLLFDKNSEEYPLIITNYEGQKRIRAKSPINAYEQENIAITGNGIIDGSGHLWRPVKQWKLTDREWQRKLKISSYTMQTKETGIWFPSQASYEGMLRGESSTFTEESLIEEQKYYDFYRPALVNIVKCDRVLIDGVTISNSPAWNVHPLFCTNITISNARIQNPFHAQNGDGLDLESCKNAHIHHTSFEVGDDGICLKSGKNAEARTIKFPTENVYIHDCVVAHAHGGFVIGSEMSRGIKNVIVKDCTFIGTDIGIRFKTQLGRGGVVEDIIIENIRMLDIIEEAIIFTAGYALTTIEKGQQVEKAVKNNEEDIPEFRNISMKNIVCLGSKTALKIQGLPEKEIHHILLEDSNIQSSEGIKIELANNIKFKNTTIDGKYYENDELLSN